MGYFKVEKEVKQSPVQFYGANRVYIDFPDETGLVGDPAIADDRRGPTKKIWLFYYDSTQRRLMRREIPYVGAKPSELGEPVQTTITTRANHFVNIDGVWYLGGANMIYRFNRIDNPVPTWLSTISTPGSNGDVNYVANCCVDRDASGKWHCWYSTFDGTNNGIRHATANSPNGPWTIEPGFWMVPSDVNASLNWLRIYYVMKDRQGRLWSVAGAGRKWGGVGNPGMDDAASVWIAPVDSITDKPSVDKWECIVDPPYFKYDGLTGSPLVNNAYAPTFLQDGDDWYLYVNTGFYGRERIIELRPKLSQAWAQVTSANDVTLTNAYTTLESTRAFIRDGIFRVSVEGVLFNNNNGAQWHTVHLRLVDAETNEVLKDYQLQNGAFAFESRQFSVSHVINVEGSRLVQLEARYEVGSGQTTPSSSRLRNVSLSIEKEA